LFLHNTINNKKADYEVQWYYKKLTAAKKSELAPKTNFTSKNRRLHYLNKRLIGTDYFSEERMRMRAPILYNYYIGKYKTPAVSRRKNLQFFAILV
jgi:hypothetical protein